jgi:hypothetical protein
MWPPLLPISQTQRCLPTRWRLGSRCRRVKSSPRRPLFPKVLYRFLYSKYTRVLTFEKLCQERLAHCTPWHTAAEPAHGKVPADKMAAGGGVGGGGGGGGFICKGQDLSTVERLVQLIAEGQDGTAEVAASLLARACQTREQQHALAVAGVWEATDCLLVSSPKGQEAGLDLAASMVRGNAEQAGLMLGRDGTKIVKLLGFVRHWRPCTRLLACTCIALAAQCGAFSLEQHQLEASVVLHTAIKLLSSEPHKEIKEKAPSILSLLIHHNEVLQHAAADTGLIDVLVSQGEAHGASARERNAVMECLECLAGNTFSKVLYTVTSQRDYTRALTFENVECLSVCNEELRCLHTYVIMIYLFYSCIIYLFVQPATRSSVVWSERRAECVL